ncbi:COG1470 family protein [Variovorax sp. GT1P44]|uniref:COG1470 family protein n=1 Tax=Variovorax sp. GT1P44 TaxID=3443742 RepID=UPI003F4792C2
MNGLPGASQALDQAGAYLRRLSPFPNSGSVDPSALLPMLGQIGRTLPNADKSEAGPVGEPVASIVSQAASVLDEEMSRGVLAARSGAAPQGYANFGPPVLRQMHDFVDNLAALWPNLQGGAAGSPSGRQLPTAGAEPPLATVKPRMSARPGERVTISMTLRNSEGRPVRLMPTATDLIGSRGGRIPGSLLECSPLEMALEPQEQKELVITAVIPAEVAPGCYSGLLVVRGLDYLRALVAIDVTGNGVAPEAVRPQSPPRTAVTPAGTPSYLSPFPTAPGSIDNTVMREAARLTEDGELGNSDAIRLLQIARRPEDLKEVLARFEPQLTREARSKLTLAAFVPLPSGVANQRFEPIFDRYPITGRTHTTASGSVVLSEVQYYNGEMVQLHGGCANVAAVREALAGSGYKPMTLRHDDGRESAIVQFWSHQLSDTSLQPYNAMFVIVAAVSNETPASEACIRADANGASSALSMFDGRFDPTRCIYENKAQLYFVRLLDSTRVAVEVGRERMGTDKRPGTIELTHEGPQRTFSIRNGTGQAVARIRFTPDGDVTAYRGELAKAAATAGIPLRELPSGTEYVYPGVARIGNGPISLWQWRTDVTPRFQPVKPDTVLFDASSEEGNMMIRWGFEPKVLGYIPNVRGVVTGIP